MTRRVRRVLVSSLGARDGNEIRSSCIDWISIRSPCAVDVVAGGVLGGVVTE